MRLLALMVCVFGITTGEFVPAGILPAIADDVGVSISAAGLLVTAYAAGMIIGGPLVTALTTRYARKPLILVLLAVAITGNLVSALAPGYGVLFGARLVTATVTSTFFANAIVIATSTVPPDKRASTVARLVLGMNLAMILGAPLGTWVGNTFGWRATFVAIAISCGAGLLLVMRLVPPVPHVAATSAFGELRVFRSSGVQLAILVTAVGSAGQLIVFTYFAPLLTDLTGFASTAVPVLLLGYGVGATAGNLVGGTLSDRAPMPSLVGLLVATIAVLLAMWALSSNRAGTAVLVVLIGAAGFAIVPGMQANVLKHATGAPTLALAVNSSAYQLAAAVAAWLGGRVIDDGPGLRPVYLVAAAVTAAGIGVTLVAWGTDRSYLRRLRKASIAS